MEAALRGQVSGGRGANTPCFSWKRFGICMIIAVVFAVGIGVGLGVGLRKDDDDDEAADAGVQYDVKEVPTIQASGALTGISATQFQSSPAIADAFKTSVAESAGVEASDVRARPSPPDARAFPL